MNPSILLIALALVHLVTGCASTAQGVREDPDEKATFRVNVPYKTVLNNISTAIRGCKGGAHTTHVYVGAPVPVPVTMDPPSSYPIIKENTEGNSARYDYVVETPFSQRVLFTADIVAKGNETEITYFTPRALIENRGNYGTKLRNWSIGSTECFPYRSPD